MSSRKCLTLLRLCQSGFAALEFGFRWIEHGNAILETPTVSRVYTGRRWIWAILQAQVARVSEEITAITEAIDERGIMNSFDFEDIKRVAKWLVLLGVVVIGIYGFRMVRRWGLHAPKETSTHPVESAGYTRILLGSKEFPGTRRRSVLRHAPYCLEFQSTSGEVEVCVVPCNMAHRADAQLAISRVTEDFASGKALGEVVGKCTGTQGRIYLTDPWKKGTMASYAVFLRSPTTTKVELEVYYWR